MRPGPIQRTMTMSDEANSGRQSRPKRLLHLFLATALFQCWHFILGFSLWAFAICAICQWVRDISFSATLLTVLGTVLGFVISYRTSSSFERYNEGRRYWANIIYNSRTFARAIWFHVPEIAVTVGASDDEKRARTLVEKKTILNLVEGFAVGVKHYLRGEEGINYEDMYHLTRYLPAYALPAGMPNPRGEQEGDEESYGTATAHEKNGLPLPVSSPTGKSRRGARGSVQPDGTPTLLPARNPPPFGICDIWPFTYLVKPLLRRGIEVKGKVAQKTHAKMTGSEHGRGANGSVVSHNVPLEITLYLSAYISALQVRKTCDVPTINLLLNTLNQLADSLTGLERILTTPIPFSFSVHLWTVTLVYCFFLPFQLWSTLKWITVPGTAVAAFIFTGFVVAGEEIEQPFGYDRNDLDLDYYTSTIIRQEMASITSVPVPLPDVFCFRPENDALFSNSGKQKTQTPDMWVQQGLSKIRHQLAKATPEAQRADEEAKRLREQKEKHHNKSRKNSAERAHTKGQSSEAIVDDE